MILNTTYIHEGLGSFVKNLATGDMEKDIASLKKEAHDIQTPEQQRLIITKIVRLLEKLIQIRHSPSKMQEFIHDGAAWFQRALNGKDAGKEMAIRTSEAITDLAKLRDQVLAKKWNDDKYNEAADKLKDKVADLLKDATNSKNQDY